MSEFKIHKGEETNTFDDKATFLDTVSLLEANGVDFETETPEDFGEVNPEDTESETTPDPEPAPQGSDDSPTLRKDPIGYLRQVNSEYVNEVKGTPAISKRGFRYIQAELDITTESEVAGWVEDPYGVVVWARAELPDGRAAEAHGEGYPSESGMDPGEFVRYADTRAKNRALSDLTSAGALAVDELRGGIDE